MNAIFIQKRNVHTISNDIESEIKALKRKNRTIYRNKHGEDIKFTLYDPPPGYIFVPSGDWFIIRYCRKLTQTLYAVYHLKSQKELGGQTGLYVLREVLKKVESKYKVK